MLKGVPYLIGGFVLCMVIVLVVVLISPRVGQEVVLVKNAELVIDWNALVIPKPRCPTALTGTKYEIEQISTLHRNGSQGEEVIYWLKPLDTDLCSGWAFRDEFQKK